MLLLESFVHRRRLAEIISRWMVNQPQEGDVRELKQIINFNVYITRIWLDAFVRIVLTELHGQEPQRRELQLKGDLKDFVVDHPQRTNRRIDELRLRYRRFPEDFYRDAPIDGWLYEMSSKDGPQLVGCSRIKRFRRIAEKGSRRIVDFMLGQIRERADVLAQERAELLGVSKTQLVTPIEQQKAEFARAELRLLSSIKHGAIRGSFPLLPIPDVAGAKIILEDSQRALLSDLMESRLGCQILEIERHEGAYNAENQKVVCRIPREILKANPPGEDVIRILAHRGFTPDLVVEEYLDFLERAEEDIIFEVIVANFEELVESEIGRSMHEDRILSQRAHPEYNGFLATNVRYLMEYILGLCRSPAFTDMEDIPVKLWVRYLPDTFEQTLLKLYVSEDVFFDRPCHEEIAGGRDER